VYDHVSVQGPHSVDLALLITLRQLWVCLERCHVEVNASRLQRCCDSNDQRWRSTNRLLKQLLALVGGQARRVCRGQRLGAPEFTGCVRT
jgi:hypothetical protein